MNKEVKCPSCGKLSVWSQDNPFRPFCSERCRLIDLGDWANESHRIPSDTPDDTFSKDTFPQYESDDPNSLDDTKS